jgi:Ca-activated chloride channel family protein
MTSERLEKEAAKHFVNALLREQDELDLMEFSDVVRELVPFTNEKKRIEAGIGHVQQGDATALYDAVYLASERLSETSAADGRRRVVVLITDGGDTVKGARYSQAMEQAQRAGAMVYAIIIVPIAADAGRNTAGEHALIQMAQDTGGKYYYANEPKDLEPAFRHVSDDLRTQYLLGYYAPKRGTDNSYRRIEVRMEDTSLRGRYDLRYRTGYYADAR